MSNRKPRTPADRNATSAAVRKIDHVALLKRAKAALSQRGSPREEPKKRGGRARMTALAPKPGFDWKRVNWGRPDSPPACLCSYCAAAISKDEVPLSTVGPTGYFIARFCSACAERWFGLRPPYPAARPK